MRRLLLDVDKIPPELQKHILEMKKITGKGGKIMLDCIVDGEAFNTITAHAQIKKFDTLPADFKKANGKPLHDYQGWDVTSYDATAALVSP